MLGLELRELLGDRGPPRERFTGQVLPVLAERLPGLLLQFRRLLLELVAWISILFLAVATSAMLRRIFWRFSSCFS